VAHPWLAEREGCPSHFHSGISALKLTEEQEAKNAELPEIDHSHIPPCGSPTGMPLGSGVSRG
jgi:hypothetical protein